MAESVTVACPLCGNEVEPVPDAWSLLRLPDHDWYPGGPWCLRSGWLAGVVVSGPA